MGTSFQLFSGSSWQNHWCHWGPTSALKSGSECMLSDAGAIATQGHGATGWGPHEIKIKACLKMISSLEVLYKIKQKNKFFLWVLEQCYLHIAISSCWQLKKRKKKKVLEATALLKIRFSFFTWPNISVLSAMLEKCIFQDKVKVDLNVQPKK